MAKPSRVASDPTAEPFFTVAEIAQRWKLSYRQVIRLIERGELVAHRFGRVWRIADADRRAFERLRRIG